MPRTPVNEDGDKDYTTYPGKPVTTAVQQYYDWLKDKTGYAKLDLTSVKLAKTLGAEFQRDSRENGSPRARTGSKPVAAPKPAVKPVAKKPAAKPAPKRGGAGATPVANKGPRRVTPKPEPVAAKPTAPRTGRRGKPAGDAPAAAPY